MCQDALRYKDGNDLDDVKQIVVSFIQLAKRLGNPRYIFERNGAAAQDSLDISQYSFDTKLKKKQNKTRANLVAAGADNSSRAFDLEIKRSLSKLKKKDVCSGSETSDDDGYSEGDETESETTVSDTESDFDVNSGAWDLKGNGLKLTEHGESVIDDRILGARMTKRKSIESSQLVTHPIDEILYWHNAVPRELSDIAGFNMRLQFIADVRIFHRHILVPSTLVQSAANPWEI
ncbi:uncharacterized protein [Zea mays]|uniref:uncharacterized protein n=1 Tax=Zea mays TaxID=4577 RepID=UPI0009A94CB3|nr:uncharacterized protein LOC103642349 [Zea mays]|eukprot:XP_020400899.1 uncharacterized protein LOC103642349 [Zea mays]